MVAAMGAYQGANAPMGWVYAVARGFERRSARATLGAAAALAAGHYLAMLAVLLPAALAITLLGVDPTAIEPWLGIGFIGFGLFKLLRARHPRALARIPPREPIRWSFAMALAHCGSPFMMLAPLVELSLLLDAGRFGATLPQHLAWSAGLAVALPAAMAAPLLLVASSLALVVYRVLGLRGVTRLWINLDLGWALIFIAMAAMMLVMAHGAASMPAMH